MKKDKKAGDRRGTNPSSLANLKPAQFSEVRNPNGNNGQRPYSHAILECSLERLAEHVRAAMNAQFRREVRAGASDIPDLYEPGITWAKANARRLNWRAAFRLAAEQPAEETTPIVMN